MHNRAVHRNGRHIARVVLCWLLAIALADSVSAAGTVTHQRITSAILQAAGEVAERLAESLVFFSEHLD